jgi:dCTP deaminase
MNGPLPDHEINSLGIVNPCESKQNLIYGRKVPSWGLQSFGYDATLDKNEFFAFSNVGGGIIDPRKFDDKLLVKMEPRIDGDGLAYFIVPSNGTALGVTREAFLMPNDVLGMVFGKSTYSRCALVINCTLLEPGWVGRLVIELHNSSPIPIKVYAEAGICQIVFVRGNLPNHIYDGKYQHQNRLITAKI